MKRAARPQNRPSVLAAAVAAGAALLLSACGSSSSSSSPKAAAGTATSGPCKGIAAKYPQLKGTTVNVGTSVGPGSYDTTDPSDPGKIVGVEPDLLKAVGDCVGFGIKDTTIDFTGLIPATQANRITAISAGMYATPERAKQVSFVTYMKAATQALVRKGNPRKITSLDTACGAQAAEAVGTVENALFTDASKKCTAAGKPAIKALTFNGNDQAVTAVRNGRADIFLTDAGVAGYLAKQSPDKLQPAFSVVSDYVFGFGVNKSNTKLLNAIHEALGTMFTDGSLTKTITKWGFDAAQAQKPEIVS